MSNIRNKKIPSSNRTGGSIPFTRPGGSNPALSTSELPADLAELFAGAPATRASDVDALNRAAAELDRDPEFLADYAKGLVVEDVLRALEASGMSKNALAEKIGTSRQYLSKILDEDRRVNFTIETLAELAAALELQLCVRLLPASERMIFLRKITVSAHVEPAGEFPEQVDFAPLEEKNFTPRNIIPFATSHERTRLSA